MASFAPVQQFSVKYWGTRGSIPAPFTPDFLETRIRESLEAFFDNGFEKRDQIAEFLQALPRYRNGGYGGNTPCVEVRTTKTQLIIDGGSGIRQLGYQLLGGPCGKGQGEVHVLFTHFHWDHLIGLPFFTPIFIPGNTIHFHAVQPELPEVIQTVFKKPFFPVPFEGLGSKIVFHQLEPRKATRFGDLDVTPYQLDHPDPCWGFRIEHLQGKTRKVYSHCVDTECTRVSREQLGPDLPLYQNVDLMTFDAQYTLMETIEKVNWGHAAATLGLDIALREKVKKVVFMHFDPAASDERIAQAEQQARRYYEGQLRQYNDRAVNWEFAREGDVIEV